MSDAGHSRPSHSATVPDLCLLLPQERPCEVWVWKVAIWQRSCWLAAEAAFHPEAVAHVEPE